MKNHVGYRSETWNMEQLAQCHIEENVYRMSLSHMNENL
jgi:hypothetical protein